jgi:DNA-binding transcriptional LysR family regulator
MRISLRQLSYVVEVAEVGSVAGAACKLRISPSSIVAAIAAAEQDFGCAIFQRRPNRGTTVTPAGNRFLAAAHSLLLAESNFDRQIDVLASVTPPSVHIGCFEPFGPLFMPALLKRFIEESHISNVVLMEGDQDQIRTWLAAGDVDFAVTYDAGLEPGAPVTPICNVPAHVVLPASDPLADRAAVSIHELVSKPFVLLDHPHNGARIMSRFEVTGTQPHVALRTRSYETVRAAVGEGLGFTFLNMRPLACTTPDSSRIVRRPLIEETGVPSILQVADIYGDAKPAFLRQFITTLRSFFKNIPPPGFAVVLPEREHLLWP